MVRREPVGKIDASRTQEPSLLVLKRQSRQCYHSVMVMYSDERRIAALLRELIQRSGTALESVEERLGWERGRLGSLMDGPQGVSFEVLLEVLPALDETPGDFFARLCGFHPETQQDLSSLRGSRADHRFEESRRVVKAALARRSTWKQERAAS